MKYSTNPVIFEIPVETYEFPSDNYEVTLVRNFNHFKYLFGKLLHGNQKKNVLFSQHLKLKY